MFSCNNSPKVGVKAFYTAINNLDITTAHALGTDSTKRQLHLLGVFLNMSSDEEISNKKKELSLSLDTINCTETNGKVMCTLCCREDNSSVKAELIKIKGKWFVHQHFGMMDTANKE